MANIGPWTTVRVSEESYTFGRGGNAIVYKATRDEGTTHVALKVLHPKKTKPDREPYKRFRDEIRVLTELGPHDGILPLLDSQLPEQADEDDRAWLAMPIATPLRAAVKGAEPEVIVGAVAEFAETLSFLHQKGISHRDIKPENLYEHAGRWKVGDFGLVDYPGKEAMTAKGKWLGPLHFMAPEMISGPDDADGRPADVFSLAKALWVLLTNQRWPPPGEVRVDTMATNIDAYRVTDRSSQLDLLIERATKHEPHRRLTMDEVARELRAWGAPAADARKPGDVSPLIGRLKAASEPGMRAHDNRKSLEIQAREFQEQMEQRLAKSEYVSTFLAADATFDPKLEQSKRVLEKCGGPANRGAERVAAEIGATVRMRAASRPEGEPKYFHLVGGFGARVFADGSAQFVFGHLIFSGHSSHWCATKESIVWLGSAEADSTATEMISFLSESFEASLETFVRAVEAGKISTDDGEIHIHGISANAARLAVFLGSGLDHSSGDPPDISWAELENGTKLVDVELRDAIQELERRRCLKTLGSIGAPHGVMSLHATFGLADLLSDAGLLGFSPKEDAIAVCRVLIAKQKMVATSVVHEESGLSPGRFNLAFAFVKDRGWAKAHGANDFGSIRGGWLEANGRTKSFTEG